MQFPVLQHIPSPLLVVCRGWLNCYSTPDPHCLGNDVSIYGTFMPFSHSLFGSSFKNNGTKGTKLGMIDISNLLITHDLCLVREYISPGCERHRVPIRQQTDLPEKKFAAYASKCSCEVGIDIARARYTNISERLGTLATGSVWVFALVRLRSTTKPSVQTRDQSTDTCHIATTLLLRAPRINKLSHSAIHIVID